MLSIHLWQWASQMESNMWSAEVVELTHIYGRVEVSKNTLKVLLALARSLPCLSKVRLGTRNHNAAVKQSNGASIKPTWLSSELSSSISMSAPTRSKNRATSRGMSFQLLKPAKTSGSVLLSDSPSVCVCVG